MLLKISSRWRFYGEPWVGAVRFFLSGSEANDLALSLCQAITGRSALATRERAYHGMTGLARDVTVQPHWHGGLLTSTAACDAPRGSTGSSSFPARRVLGSAVSPLDSPDIRRGAPTDVAAVIIDYTQGGVYYDGRYQDAVAAEGRQAGVLWIADEVVHGLGRQGRWFAFQGASSRPDIVTLGKPLGGGGMPAGAVVVSQELLAELDGQSWQTYSTYRGHPMMVAAMRAYLRVLVRDDLLERVDELDGQIEQRMKLVADQHPSVARIDGRGMALDRRAGKRRELGEINAQPPGYPLSPRGLPIEPFLRQASFWEPAASATHCSWRRRSTTPTPSSTRCSSRSMVDWSSLTPSSDPPLWRSTPSSPSGVPSRWGPSAPGRQRG